jgi:L,D-transpeptidase catalytic domain/Putative peptidoglycan binding domain
MRPHLNLRTRSSAARWPMSRRLTGATIGCVVLGTLWTAQPVGTAFAQSETTPSASATTVDPNITSSTTSTVPASSTGVTTSPVTTAPASTVPGTTVPATSGPSTTLLGGTTPSTVPGSGSSTTVPKGSTTTTTTTLVPGQIVIPAGKVLKVGSKGADVLALEKRLEQLMIDTGKVDGKFDWATWQGVVAFQKYWGLKRTGKVDNALRVEIQNSASLSGYIFSGPGTRLEVDKSKQLLFMYKNNRLWRVVAVSTGSGKKYCDYSKKAKKQICGTASTPVGRFKIQRRISGWRESDLGRLYNPLYFNGGIAFHGAPSVPAYPASHGCVRLPMNIAEWFPDEVANGTAVYVYD